MWGREKRSVDRRTRQEHAGQCDAGARKNKQAANNRGAVPGPKRKAVHAGQIAARQMGDEAKTYQREPTEKIVAAGNDESAQQDQARNCTRNQVRSG